MKITNAAISLNVKDVSLSAEFLKKHFYFFEEMSDKGFVSLKNNDLSFNIIFLETGLSSLKPETLKYQDAKGLIIAFVVNNIDQEYKRIQDEDVSILTEIQTEPWGERFFQVEDPNGIIIQLVEWVN